MIDPVRRSQIITLLSTRDDHLPQPIRRDHSPAGFIHNTPVRETCPDCFGENPGKVGCATCKSRGYIEYVRERDPYSDTDVVKPYGMTGDRHETRRERDREITRLDEQLAPPRSEADLLAEANQRPYLWELERERKWRDYDYEPLDRALDALRERDEGAYKLIHACWVYGWLECSAVMESAIERGLTFIDARMPAIIRAPGAEHDAAAAKDSLRYGKRPEHEQARQRRTERVLRAHIEWGWSTEQIAAHESLARRRVQQLIAEHNAATGVDAAVASGPAA